MSACGIVVTPAGEQELVVSGDYLSTATSIYNIDKGSWRRGASGSQLPEYVTWPGSVQFGDTFLATAGNNIYEWNSEEERYDMRPEKIPRARDFSFALIIDGDILNCA